VRAGHYLFPFFRIQILRHGSRSDDIREQDRDGLARVFIKLRSFLHKLAQVLYLRAWSLNLSRLMGARLFLREGNAALIAESGVRIIWRIARRADELQRRATTFTESGILNVSGRAVRTFHAFPSFKLIRNKQTDLDMNTAAFLKNNP
jgi:hypothetical protein